MSHYDYKMSQVLAAECVPFYALIMAALRGADTDNYWKLSRAFPEVARELTRRYNAPGGFLPEEGDTRAAEY